MVFMEILSGFIGIIFTELLIILILFKTILKFKYIVITFSPRQAFQILFLSLPIQL